MATSDASMKVPHIPHTEEMCNGDIVDGVVVEVGSDSILLDVACKTDALLARSRDS